MENASKALIIAGAILLSILLISLGIMIFNQAQSAIDGSGMSDAEIQAFNAKFLKYEGKQKGSKIRSLVQEVMANNNSEEASDETMVAINADNYTIDGEEGDYQLIKLEAGKNKTPSFGSPANSVTFYNTETYEVSFAYYNGKIAVIYIGYP